MIRKIADNIYSPLGFTTDENYAAVKQGRSMLRSYPAGTMDLPEPFTASLFDWDGVGPLEGYTRFERIVIQSVSRALTQTAVDVHSERLLFILATTKGNVELLDGRSPQFPQERVLLGPTARQIADYFGFVNQPLVVSNACISGLSAQITALRLLESGSYDTVIVCGADVQSRFVISGFGSFKALSPAACRPFDIERVGLNLGEAAASIIYESISTESCQSGGWLAVRGAVRNDAYHISSPSPKGEGAFRAIRAALGNEAADSLAFINVHGTSTLYNDEMESAAIDRAGLLDVPVNSLKGYYGHTMGAAGVLESILSMKAVDDGTVLGTRGYEELGVSHPVKVSASHSTTRKQAFLKLLSGFGGCNAAMLFSKELNEVRRS
jgi:3-oxoacyl-[acyl-carrier-protein] synthase-1